MATLTEPIPNTPLNQELETNVAYEGLVRRISEVTQTMFITHARQVPRTRLTERKYAFIKKYYETESQRVKALQDILAHDVIKYLMEHPL